MAVEKNNVVVVEHEFSAPVAKVFQALKAGRLFFNCGAWPEGTELDFRVGGKYQLQWGHHGKTYGEFTEIVENKRIAFTWNSDEMEVKSRVGVDLISSGSGCKVKLRHEGFTDLEIAESHNGGWTGGLAGFDNELTKYQVKIEREFQVPVEMLYEACSGMKFFSHMGATGKEATVDFRMGGKFSFESKCGLQTGEFLEIVKNKKIVFTWDKAPDGAPVTSSTRVSMEFGPWGDDGKNSYIELIQTGFTSSESAVDHHTGWNGIIWDIYKKTHR